jgi:hypothetical protein
MSLLRSFIVLTCLLPALGGRALAAAEVPAGTYVPAHDQHADIEAAIETSVSALNIMVRSIARGRLRDDNVEFGHISVARSATEVAFTFDNGKTIHLPKDGTPVHWVNEHNDESNVTLKETDGQLVQTYQGSGGTRTNTFRWDAAANQLLLDVRTTSPRLPQPVAYTLIYRPGT